MKSPEIKSGGHADDTHKPDKDVACKLPLYGRANLASLLPGADGADQENMMGIGNSFELCGVALACRPHQEVKGL